MAFCAPKIFPSNCVLVKFDEYFYFSSYFVYDSEYESSESDDDSDASSEVIRVRLTITLSKKVLRIFRSFELCEELKLFVNATLKHSVAYDSIPWLWCQEVGYHIGNL